MSSDFDRDDSIDRLLKGAQRGPANGAAATPSCLDAETLAAWADDGLPQDQVRLVEAHVAGCARCQALAAAFTRTDDPVVVTTHTPAKVVAFRPLSPKVWLPIAGTIAASLLIWVTVRERSVTSPPLLEPQLSQADGRTVPTAPQGQANQQAPPPALAEPRPADQARAASETATKSKTAPRSTEATAPAPVAAPPPPPPPPPPTLLVPTTTPVPTVGVAGQVSTAATERRADAAFRAMVAPRVEFSSGLAREEKPAALGGVANRTAGRGAAGGAGRGGAATAPAAMDALQQIPPAHWRILESDVVQKSADKASWETISFDPPVQGLLNGVAPSPLVCWLVGRNGLVLVTANGREFARVTAPAAIDLVSVTAVDARQATVTAAGGRVFTTTDGGKTWSARFPD